ncbi:MAG: hypothetical protein HYZ40_17235 [Rhodospirillales bacterium]|nr:hypothetical protein [Rhodospirillales bacterium]
MRPALVLLIAAGLLLGPSLVLGTHITHSAPENLTYATQASEQFRAGILFPRWMSDSYGGLGGPSLFFYPPMAFLIDALVSVVTFDMLSVSYRLVLTSLLLLWASGLTMRAWLRRETEVNRAALVGAAAYMAAPYHLLDYYMRGAFAEFTAYAVLPVVMLAIRLVVDGQRAGPPLLALSYATLILSHLPTTLLVSVTVIPAYVLYCTRRPVVLLSAGMAGALGIGIAATYLVPAMLLQDWISADQLWMPFYHIEKWFLLRPGLWPEPNIMFAIASLALATTLLNAGLYLVVRQMPADDRRRHKLGFWIAVSLGSLVLIAGLVPWFWQLPHIAKVQFPWRLMMVVEFASITALCLAPLANLRRATRYTFVMAAVAVMPGVALVFQDAVARFDLTLKLDALYQNDSRVHQPRGFPQNPHTPYSELGLEPLATVPTITCTPAANLCRAEARRFGALHIELESDQPTTVVLRRFFFPGWQIDGVAAIVPTDPFRLVSFVAPAGRHTFHLLRETLSVERWSWAVSGLSLGLLLVWSLFESRIRRS